MNVSCMRHEKTLFVGVSLTFLLLSVSASLFAQTTARAEVARPALLAYVQETARGTFDLRLHDPVSKLSEKIAVMADRPALIVWRVDRPEVITVLSDTTYSTPYPKKPYVSNPIGDQPPKGLELLDGWIDKDGKGLVVLGSFLDADAKASCVLYRVPAKGPWRKTKAATGKSDGISEPCDAFASRHRVTSFSVSNPQLMKAYQCVGRGSICNSSGDKRYDAIKGSIEKSNKEFVGADLADPGKTPFFLGFGTTMGDTPHLMGPAHVLQRDGKAAKPATLEAPKQVQVAVKGSLILVAEEYSGNDPLLFDADTGQVLLSIKGASSAVWVP
jgi:hypothetical protein